MKFIGLTLLRSNLRYFVNLECIKVIQDTVQGKSCIIFNPGDREDFEHFNETVDEILELIKNA
jgi:hypothetical protein